MTTRAAPMAPEARREALVDVTLPLLRRHGRRVSTRQIAQAAGVAEGTIFRVFATKEALIDAALAKAFRPGQMERELEALDLSLPLRDRLVALVAVFQRRFTEIFGLMSRVGMIGPPDAADAEVRDRWRQRLADQLADYVGDDADQLSVPVTEFLHAVRLLTFSGSHPDISDHHLLTPEQIVDLLLYGALARPDRPEGD